MNDILKSEAVMRLTAPPLGKSLLPSIVRCLLGKIKNMNGLTSGTGQLSAGSSSTPVKEPQIHREMTILDSAVDVLNQRLLTLVERIKPLMRMDEAEATHHLDGKEPIQLVGLARRTRNITEKIDRISNDTLKIIDLLEI